MENNAFPVVMFLARAELGVRHFITTPPGISEYKFVLNFSPVPFTLFLNKNLLSQT